MDRHVKVLCFVCFMAGLVYLVVVRLFAEFLSFPTKSYYYKRVKFAERVDPQALVRHINNLERALEFRENPLHLVMLGTIHEQLSGLVASPTERKRHVSQAIIALEEAVQWRSRDHYSWLKLTSLYLRSSELGSEKKALQAWSNSIEFGANDPLIYLPRIHLGIIMYPSMSRKERQQLRKQVSLSYQWDKARLRFYAHDNDLVDWIKFLIEDQEAESFLDSYIPKTPS